MEISKKCAILIYKNGKRTITLFEIFLEKYLKNGFCERLMVKVLCKIYKIYI